MELTQILKLSALGLITSSSAMAANVTANFDDGTLQGWTNNVPSGATGEDFVTWDTTADDNAGKTVARSADYMLIEASLDDRDGDTNVQLLSSPALLLTSTTTVSIWTLGGTGPVATPTWTNYANLPTAATGTGFMGIALRRASDGEYLLFDRRSGSGQSDRAINWLEVGWDATQISTAISGDAPTETYHVDLIDSYVGGWGWIGADDVTFTNVTVVPEPSSVALLGLGGLALILRRRRA